MHKLTRGGIKELRYSFISLFSMFIELTYFKINKDEQNQSSSVLLALYSVLISSTAYRISCVLNLSQYFYAWGLWILRKLPFLLLRFGSDAIVKNLN